MNFQNAVFILDYFHVFDSILPNLLQKYYDHVEPYLRQMVDSATEKYFEFSLKQAKLKIKSINNGREDREASASLDMFADKRSCYASHILKICKGTMGRKGSSVAESNHSSVLVYLNDGVRKQNDYCEDPHALMNDLFQIQKGHIQKWNVLLQEQHVKMECEIRTLQSMEGNSFSKCILLDAAKHLTVESYETFQKDVMSSQHLSLDTEHDEINECDVTVIHDVRYPNSTPRKFSDMKQRCDCERQVGYMAQCRHEIMLHGKFILGCFALCHHRRQRVEGSSIGWTKPCNIIEEICDTNTDDGITIDMETSDNNTNIIDIDNSYHQDPLDPIHLHRKSVQPVSKKVINTMCNNIIYNYSKLSTETQLAVSGSLISIEQLVNNGESNSQALPGDMINSETMLMDHMTKFVDSYNTAFKSPTTFNTSSQRKSALPARASSSTIRKKQSKKRLRGRRQIQVDKLKRSKCAQDTATMSETNDRSTILPVKKNAKKEPMCSFCNKTGHKCTRCEIMNQHKLNATTVDSKTDRDNLLIRLCNATTVSPPSDIGKKSLIVDLEKAKNNAHFIIHRVFGKKDGIKGHVNMEDMNMLVSFIYNGGIAQQRDKEILVDGKEVHRLVMHANSMLKKKNYTFDKTTHNHHDTESHAGDSIIPFSNEREDVSSSARLQLSDNDQWNNELDLNLEQGKTKMTKEQMKHQSGFEA